MSLRSTELKRADVIFPQEMNSHKSSQPKSKSFCDQQDNFNVEGRLTFTKIIYSLSRLSCFYRTYTNIIKRIHQTLHLLDKSVSLILPGLKAYTLKHCAVVKKIF